MGKEIYMATKVKIKIEDNSKLRMKIDELYKKTNQVELAKWSLIIAKHILDMAGMDYHSAEEIVNGFEINEMWQVGKARMHDIRQAAFQIHKLARESSSEINKTALRVAGHAVASGHMKEHAMVASDYAIKVINMLYTNDFDAVTKEREWQLKELRKFHQIS